jgi:hypothetical protein
MLVGVGRVRQKPGRAHVVASMPEVVGFADRVGVQWGQVDSDDGNSWASGHEVSIRHASFICSD